MQSAAISHGHLSIGLVTDLQEAKRWTSKGHLYQRSYVEDPALMISHRGSYTDDSTLKVLHC